MKRLLFLIFALSISYLSISQTVENIQVEPEGENIKINFRIGGSSESQIYNVYLTCSMDGQARFAPKTVIGDAGENIRGGKSFYTILWDVFEDVEEVGNAEFFVKVELIRDPTNQVKPIQTQSTSTDRVRPISSQNQTQSTSTDRVRPISSQNQTQPTSTDRVKPISTSETSSGRFNSSVKPASTSTADVFSRKFYLGYNGSSFSPAGFSTGTLGNWGAYASFRVGIYVEIYDLREGTIVGGLTKFIAAKEKFRLHAFAGGGLGDFLDEFTMEAGLMGVVVNRVNLSLGLSYTPIVWFSESGVADVVFGIGIVF